ncbi:lysozyme [Acetobacter sp. LMG 32666]|uniref:lysozyme n=1 Tax=Acetobacter sp. LMG 32666 TaxID=2959295 RepID=UPI0030C82CE8
MNDPINMAADLCRQFEGLRLSPYLCPAGYWSIGYGNRFLANGAAVTARTAPITAEQADALLLLTLRRIQTELHQLVQAPQPPGKEAALLDFAFNLGLSALAGSTLLKLLNSGHDMQAGEQLMLWNHMHKNGQLITEPGLTRRRQAEWHLWVGAA